MKGWNVIEGRHDVTVFVGPTTDEMIVTVGSNTLVLVVTIVDAMVTRGGVAVKIIVDGGALIVLVRTSVLENVVGGSVTLLKTV